MNKLTKKHCNNLEKQIEESKTHKRNQIKTSDRYNDYKHKEYFFHSI